MGTGNRIIELAVATHRQYWSPGSDVSAQTKKSNAVCREWQRRVVEEFGERCRFELSISDDRNTQKIDIVDLEERTAYELKSSRNNVHMEVYRDVFKVLVYNHRHPGNPLRKLVFLAPQDGIAKLGREFTDDVIAISSKNDLTLALGGI